MARWPTAGNVYPVTPKAYPATPKAYPATLNAFPAASSPILTFSQIATLNGNTNIREFNAANADLAYDAGTGLVNTATEKIAGVLNLTGAGATRPVYAAADGSTVATSGKLPGRGEVVHTRAANTQLINASLNRAQEHMVCLIGRFDTIVNNMRFVASAGTNARQVFFISGGNPMEFGSAAGGTISATAPNGIPSGEFALWMCHFKGAAGAELVAKHFYNTANDGAGTATGFQIGRDVTAGNSSNVTWSWMGICDGAFGPTQRNLLRTWANSLCVWDNVVSAYPVGGEDIRIVVEGDSKANGNGGGGGDLPPWHFFTTAGQYNRVINKSSGGDTLLGAGGITAQYPGANGAGTQFVTATNSDFALEQVLVIDVGTNDLVGGATAANMLTDATFGLDVLLGLAAATGYKVVLCTQTRGNYTGAQETERLDFNTGIRARASATVAIAELADTVASPTIIPGTFSDGVYWFDGFHNTTLVNQTIKAPIISAAIATL